MTTRPKPTDPVTAFSRGDGTTESHDIDHGRVIGIWENVKHHDAKGDGVADDTAAIQAAIDAIGTGGGTVFFPPGRYKFSTLTLANPGVCLAGANWSADQDWTQAFGHPNFGTHCSGTILISTATSGDALLLRSDSALGQWQLRDFFLLGPGSGTSIGVHIGSATRASTGNHISNVLVANFATGVKVENYYESVASGLAIRGCQTGLHLTNNTNNNAWIMPAVQWTTVKGIYIEDAGSSGNAFTAGIFQNCVGTALSVNGGQNTFDTYWFENLVGGSITKEIEMVGGSVCCVVRDTIIGTSGGTLDIGGARNELQSLRGDAHTLNVTGLDIVLDRVDWDYFSVVDSGTRTQRRGMPWVAYTPVLAGAGWALGAGTAVGYYSLEGRTCHFRAVLTFGTGATFGASSPNISLPPPACQALIASMARAEQNLNNGWSLEVDLLSASSVIVYTRGTLDVYGMVSSTSPFAWASQDKFYVSGSYRV